MIAGNEIPDYELAMQAYLAVAAYEYVVPVEAISETDHLRALVEWPRDEKGMLWRIINPNDRIHDGPGKGKLMPPVAIVTHGYNGELWEVALFELQSRGGQPFLVRFADGKMTVVTQLKAGGRSMSDHIFSLLQIGQSG